MRYRKKTPHILLAKTRRALRALVDSGTLGAFKESSWLLFHLRRTSYA
jgi:hypothetical protein